jgi:DNA repair protein RadC
MQKVLDLPRHKRPREKIAEMGAQSLSDVELLMVLLGSGTRGRPVHKVARSLRSLLLQQPGEPSFERVSEVRGVGAAKAASLLAAFELARRKFNPEHVLVRKPADILPLVHDLRARKQEHFVVISLNGNHGVIRTHIVTIGLANFCQVHPREVFAQALVDRATDVVLAHNHPSRSTDPSPEDIAVTKRLCSAAEVLGIKVLDHVVFGAVGYTSIRALHPDIFARAGQELLPDR